MRKLILGLFVLTTLIFTIPEDTLAQAHKPDLAKALTNLNNSMVYIAKGSYRISKFETTQYLWYAVLKLDTLDKDYRAQYPIAEVSWREVQLFFKVLNKLTGKKYRLPTESEWDWCAHGALKSKHTEFAGSNDINEVGWYKLNSDSSAHPVALKKPNEIGLYDMTGNVAEWCSDKFDEARYVFRGGCWMDELKTCYIPIRDSGLPDDMHPGIGFRIVEDN